MPIYSDPIVDNRGLRAYGLDAYPSTTGEVVGAAFEEAFKTNPTPSLYRSVARDAGTTPQPIYEAQQLGLEAPQEPADMLDPAQANERFGIPNELSFDVPVSARTAEELYGLKRDELMRRDVMMRAQGGIAQNVAKFGAAFGASVLDPLNIASGFIPVVGEARYATWAAKYGKTAARLAQGGLEGFAGAAALEPIVYGVAKSEQADYEATDSILNLAFGTLLGGGLHAGLGRLGDMMQSRGLPEPTLRGAVAAVQEGEPVRVDAFLRDQLLSSTPVTRRTLSEAFDEGLPADLRELLGQRLPERTVSDEAFGPSAEGLFLARQSERVASQFESAKADFERLQAQFDQTKSIGGAETERAKTLLDEATALQKQHEQKIEPLQTALAEAQRNLERAEGRAATLEGVGIGSDWRVPVENEDPKLTRYRRQAETAAAEKDRLTAELEAAQRARDDAKESARVRQAELKALRENYKGQIAKAQEQLSQPLERAKSRLEQERANLDAARNAQATTLQMSMADLRSRLEDARARARADFLAQISEINRRGKFLSGEDIGSIEEATRLHDAVEDPEKELADYERLITEMDRQGQLTDEDRAELVSPESVAAERNARAAEALANCQILRG